MPLRLQEPVLQVSFAAKLDELRSLQLGEALMRTVGATDIRRIDADLARLVPQIDLSRLAGQGIRGERLFATPTLLEANPFLLGYYRLVLGYSQKEFYTTATGISRFKSMEIRGEISPGALSDIEELCQCLVSAASFLCRNIEKGLLTNAFLDDLAILTLGPQLRGGANVERGVKSLTFVKQIIREIVNRYLVAESANQFEIENSAKRRVVIKFASDPDVVIFEKDRDGGEHRLVAIEVKGGTDFSNIHNRVGEAEKSHQKARILGYTVCWTVVNVDAINLVTARKESPTTQQFFLLGELLKAESAEYRGFVNQLIHLLSLPNPEGETQPLNSENDKSSHDHLSSIAKKPHRKKRSS